MKIGFIAHAVHRRGGMERAAAEILTRLAEWHTIEIVAEQCEVDSPNVHWTPLHAPKRPAVLNATLFRRRSAHVDALKDCDAVGCIGASASQAEVVTAQFCHAAFTAKFGGLRGGNGVGRRVWQQYVQGIFAAQERAIYSDRRLRCVIAVSQGTSRELQEYYGVDPAIISVIPNGVDPGVFQPAPSREEKLRLRRSLGIAHDGLLAVFVGGDWNRKGVADAVRGVARVNDVQLVVVGSWNAEPFKELARAEGAADRVIFAGPSAQPQRFLAAGDVFIFPSRYEAFSLVTIEAAACGLPLIATRINGTEEFITHGENGFFVEPDADDIATHLRTLRDGKAQLESMSIRSHQNSLAYHWQHIAEQTERVYRLAVDTTQQSRTSVRTSREWP